MIQHLTEKNFEENIKDGIKFVAFTAQWCGYCQKQKPILNELSEKNIWVGEVDSDSNPSLIKKYGIQAFPSFALFKQGKLVTKFVGYKTKYELLDTLLKYIK